MSKEKKQFRLFDVYRYAVTAEESKIKGIVSYECSKDAISIVVCYEDYTGRFPDGMRCNYFAENEFELKQVIKEVNKRLGNCIKPGPRRYK